MKDLGGVSSSNDGVLLDLHGSDTVRRAGRGRNCRGMVGNGRDKRFVAGRRG
jgi:hypothetical protein